MRSTSWCQIPGPQIRFNYLLLVHWTIFPVQIRQVRHLPRAHQLPRVSSLPVRVCRRARLPESPSVRSLAWPSSPSCFFCSRRDEDTVSMSQRSYPQTWTSRKRKNKPSHLEECSIWMTRDRRSIRSTRPHQRLIPLSNLVGVMTSSSSYLKCNIMRARFI